MKGGVGKYIRHMFGYWTEQENEQITRTSGEIFGYLLVNGPSFMTEIFRGLDLPIDSLGYLALVKSEKTHGVKNFEDPTHAGRLVFFVPTAEGEPRGVLPTPQQEADMIIGKNWGEL